MKNGFSLVEILVSIAVISIISGFGIQTFAAAQQRARLEEDVAKVVLAIRKAQNSALAPSKSETNIGDNVICAIKLKIENQELKLYAGYVSPGGNCITTQDPYLNAGKINYSSIEDGSFSEIEFTIPSADPKSGDLDFIKLTNSGISKTINVTAQGLINIK